jgi:LPXTG-motif cell wall-anchored protein
MTSLSVSKSWIDDLEAQRPDTVHYTLFAKYPGDSKETYVTEKDGLRENQWHVTFENLHSHRNGQLITYRIVEGNVPNYTNEVQMSGSAEQGYQAIVTNTLIRNEINGTKAWIFLPTGTQPPMAQIRLIGHHPETNQVMETIELTEINRISNVGYFTSARGLNPWLNYTIEETNIPEGVSVSMSWDSEQSGTFIVENSYPKPSVPNILNGQKIWNLANEMAVPVASIEIELFVENAEGTRQSTGKITQASRENNWQFEFDIGELPALNLGERYVVQEITELPGFQLPVYSQDGNGNFLIHNAPLNAFDLNLNKTSNIDNLPLGGATFRLTDDNGNSRELTSNDDGKISFTNLFGPAGAGERIYQLEEISAPAGHTTSNQSWQISVPQNGQVTITTNGVATDYEVELDVVNSFVPQQLQVEKYNAATNERLAGSIFTLYRNLGMGRSEPIATLTGNGEKLENLLPGAYYLKETTTPDHFRKDEVDYQFRVNLDGTFEDEISRDRPASSGFYLNTDGVLVLVNYNEPQILKDIPVEKIWIDQNNLHQNRPSSVEIELWAIAGGISVSLVDEVELSEANDWKAVFTQVPKFAEDGAEISYALREKTPGGYYRPVFSGNVDDGFVVTNVEDPVNITVNKNWENNEKPAETLEITYILKADGEEIQRKTAVGPDWSVTFDELNTYHSGEKIHYTVEEVDNAAYEQLQTSPDYLAGDSQTDFDGGFTITNRRTVDEEVIPVHNGEEEPDGDEPEDETPPANGAPDNDEPQENLPPGNNEPTDDMPSTSEPEENENQVATENDSGDDFVFGGNFIHAPLPSTGELLAFGLITGGISLVTVAGLIWLKRKK